VTRPAPAALGNLRAGGLDLRLAIGSAAAWLAILVALRQTPRVVLLAAVLAAAMGAAALVATHRGAPAAALVAFCIALVLIPLAGRLARSRASPLAQLAEH
jgi:hypothetical protein